MGAGKKIQKTANNLNDHKIVFINVCFQKALVLDRPSSTITGKAGEKFGLVNFFVVLPSVPNTICLAFNFDFEKSGNLTQNTHCHSLSSWWSADRGGGVGGRREEEQEKKTVRSWEKRGREDNINMERSKEKNILIIAPKNKHIMQMVF
jgi:hypothetical protein